MADRERVARIGLEGRLGVSVAAATAAAAAQADATQALADAAAAQADVTTLRNSDAVLKVGNQTVDGIKTFTSDPIVPDEAYGVGWNGSMEPPTKNAVYDKIETVVAGAPALHDTTHENGGTDEINVGGLSGLLADAQTPLAHTHPWSDVTGEPTTLAGYGITDGVATAGAQAVAGVKTFSDDPIIPDEAYGAGWNGSLEPPTKNAVYDKIETLAPGAGASATTVEVNLGSTRVFEGKFTITDAAIVATSKVLCWQAPGPYTGKGTLADEAAIQPVTVVAVVPATGTAVVYWQTPPQYAVDVLRGNGKADRSVANAVHDPAIISQKRIGKVRGNVKFSYMVLS